jgi:hypothetical protein
MTLRRSGSIGIELSRRERWCVQQFYGKKRIISRLGPFACDAYPMKILNFDFHAKTIHVGGDCVQSGD